MRYVILGVAATVGVIVFAVVLMRATRVRADDVEATVVATPTVTGRAQVPAAAQKQSTVTVRAVIRGGRHRNDDLRYGRTAEISPDQVERARGGGR